MNIGQHCWKACRRNPRGGLGRVQGAPIASTIPKRSPRRMRARRRATSPQPHGAAHGEPGPCLSFCLTPRPQPFTGGHPKRIRAVHVLWRPVVDGASRPRKRAKGQPHRSCEYDLDQLPSGNRSRRAEDSGSSVIRSSPSRGALTAWSSSSADASGSTVVMSTVQVRRGDASTTRDNAIIET